MDLTFKQQPGYAHPTGSVEFALKAGAITAVASYVGGELAGGQATFANMASWSTGTMMNFVTQLFSAVNPEAGGRLGRWLKPTFQLATGGPGAFAKTLADDYLKRKYISPAMQKFAERHGMSLADLNLTLGLLSIGGNKLVGSRATVDENGVHLRGFANRGRSDPDARIVTDAESATGIGLSFDVIDAALAYQGLNNASDGDAIAVGNGGHVSGHSLGGIGGNNLVRNGYFKSATTFALPFGNSAVSAPPRLQVWDPISGGIFGFILNPESLFGGHVYDMEDASGNTCAHSYACFDE